MFYYYPGNERGVHLTALMMDREEEKRSNKRYSNKPQNTGRQLLHNYQLHLQTETWFPESQLSLSQSQKKQQHRIMFSPFFLVINRSSLLQKFQKIYLIAFSLSASVEM